MKRIRIVITEDEIQGAPVYTVRVDGRDVYLLVTADDVDLQVMSKSVNVVDRRKVAAGGEGA